MSYKAAPKHYDFVIIGSGPAGHAAAICAAKAGVKTAIIDRREQRGGVCLHAGTIPSKTLREAVMHLRGVRLRSFYKEKMSGQGQITLEDLHVRIDKVLAQQMDVLDHQLRRNGVDIYYGQAEFEDGHTLRLTTLEDGEVGRLQAGKILVCTGTVPRRPPEIPFDQEVIFDSNFLFSSKNKRLNLPESLIIVGAGVIGTEYASIFGSLGCKVWLVDQRDELFRFVDDEIALHLSKDLQNEGVELRMGHKIGKISRSPSGQARLELDGGEVIEADVLAYTMGRTACVEPLHLERVGVVLTKHGTVEVNETLQTGHPDIYAAGDVIGFPALASTSSSQGIIAAQDALGLPAPTKATIFPFAIYSIPEIAMVGKMERELVADKIPFAKGVTLYRENPKAAIIGDETGAVKILFCPDTHKIFGIHIIGDLASELIHIGLMVMSLDGTVDTFVNNVFNYPTLASAYKMAARNGLNSLEGKNTTRDIS